MMAEAKTDRRFPCIVCNVITDSIDKLHHHQKHCHTTEELSRSVIYLVHFMSLKFETVQVQTLNPLVLQGYEIDYNPYAPSVVNSSVEYKAPLFYVDVETTTPGAGGAVLLSGMTQEEARCNGQNTENFDSSWELELGRVPEISYESFLESAEGICKDLEDLERLRRKGFDRRVSRSTGRAAQALKYCLPPRSTRTRDTKTNVRDRIRGHRKDMNFIQASFPLRDQKATGTVAEDWDEPSEVFHYSPFLREVIPSHTIKADDEMPVLECCFSDDRSRQ